MLFPRKSNVCQSEGRRDIRMKLEQVTLRGKGWILEEIEDANKPDRKSVV